MPYNKQLTNFTCSSRYGEYGPQSWQYAPTEANIPQYGRRALVSKRLILALSRGVTDRVQRYSRLLDCVCIFFLLVDKIVYGLPAFSHSFAVKNNNIRKFFAVLVSNEVVSIMNLPALLQNKNTWLGPFPRKRSVLQNPDRESTNQSAGICPRLALPYSKRFTYITVSKQ